MTIGVPQPDRVGLARKIITRLESASGPLGVREWDLASALGDARRLLEVLEADEATGQPRYEGGLNKAR